MSERAEKIGISDEPTKGEYRWIHVQCKRDHDRDIAEVFDSEEALLEAIEKYGNKAEE